MTAHIPRPTLRHGTRSQRRMPIALVSLLVMSVASFSLVWAKGGRAVVEPDLEKLSVFERSITTDAVRVAASGLEQQTRVYEGRPVSRKELSPAIGATLRASHTLELVAAELATTSLTLYRKGRNRLKVRNGLLFLQRRRGKRWRAARQVRGIEAITAFGAMRTHDGFLTALQTMNRNINMRARRLHAKVVARRSRVR